MKRFLSVFLCGLMFTALIGCNAQIIDTTWKYDRAQIKMPDGSIVEGEVFSWKDYENSDSVQVNVDGKVYYTHLANIVLISE